MGLVQESRISIANALELRLSYTNHLYIGVNYAITVVDNGLSYASHQAIMWTNAGLMLILETQTKCIFLNENV